MCRTDTNRTIWAALRALACIGLLCEIGLLSKPAMGQSTPAAPAPAWRKLGNKSVGLNLAGPAGGPVESVWYSPSGGVLYARAASGPVFETWDFEVWTASKTTSAAPAPPAKVR